METYSGTSSTGGCVATLFEQLYAKSYVGLMRHLRFAEDPNYRAYCIRKNSSAIMASGGLFWEAVELYRKYDPKLQVKLKDQKLVFSSGAEVSFSHYENDTAANKYQGKFIA